MADWMNAVHHIKPSECRSVKETSHPEVNITLLTIFTTVRLEKTESTRLVIKNWATFRPVIQPVLFTTVGSGWLNDYAHEHGWDILPVPGVNQKGTPFIKGMYETAYKKYNSHFYAFASGDLLFTVDLIHTLQSVNDFLRSEPNVDGSDLTRPFLVGKRYDYLLNDSITELWKPEMVEETLKNKPIKIGPSDALDYFVTKRYGYPWQLVPDLIIGRVAYDNYLMLMARLHKLLTIDLTRTNQPLHVRLCKKCPKPPRPDGGFNKDIIHKIHPKGVPWIGSLTTSAQGYTTFEESGYKSHVVVRLREHYQHLPRGPSFKIYDQMKFNDSYVIHTDFEVKLGNST